MKVLFTPKHAAIAHLSASASEYIIANEPMLYSSDFKFASANGGPLTRYALEEMKVRMNSVPLQGTHGWWVIDSKVVMLMPGQYPSIPGWHCDAVPREERGAQPDLTNLSSNIRHYTITVSSVPELSNTMFVQYPVTIDVNTNKVWESVHAHMQRIMAHTIITYPEGTLVEFSQPSLHRATAASAQGWRWWLRCSQYYRPPINQMRNQVQVYATPGGGW